ncbi:monocarboxylate transporter 14-like [Apostichopus japonicus]|uniref:monocarboxylate transporter 14-like n=1 Tax=Stichopus japonicus TaxID=307972 RepID=UPI003AB7213E
MTSGIINQRSIGVFLSGVTMVFLFTGSFKANGVLYTDTMDEFQSSNFLIGSAYVLQAASAFTIAGIAGSAFPGISNRSLGVTGGILYGLGFTCQGFMGTSLWHLFTFLGITAIGGGLIHFALFMAFMEHFKDKFPVALAARELSTYIGISVMPPLIEVFRSYYGLHGSYLLLGAISWNFIVCGVLLKPVIGAEEQRMNHNFGSGKMFARLKRRFCGKRDHRLIHNGAKEDDMGDNILISMFSHSSVINHPNFGIFLTIHSIFYYTFSAWALFLVPFGVSLGYTSNEAVYLSTAGGLGGFCGKLLSILLFHFDKVNIISGGLLPSCLISIGLLVYIVTSSYPLLILSSFLCGFTLGYADSTLNGMIPDYLCRHHVRNGSAISYLYGGIAMQLGGSISGAILDYTSSYTWLFSIMVLSHLCMGVLALILQLRDSEIAECIG